MSCCQTINITDGTLVFVPADKTLESIHFTDGTCELFLELDNETLGALYAEAGKRGCSIDEIIVEALEHELAKLEDAIDNKGIPA